MGVSAPAPCCSSSRSPRSTWPPRGATSFPSSSSPISFAPRLSFLSSSGSSLSPSSTGLSSPPPSSAPSSAASAACSASSSTASSSTSTRRLTPTRARSTRRASSLTFGSLTGPSAPCAAPRPWSRSSSLPAWEASAASSSPTSITLSGERPPRKCSSRSSSSPSRSMDSCPRRITRSARSSAGTVSVASIPARTATLPWELTRAATWTSKRAELRVRERWREGERGGESQEEVRNQALGGGKESESRRICRHGLVV
mmetsp:Transcript_12502/g.25535  ORF Transcript_12502/g.25535 Transcript_12502/m.25535 type:complete len:257 (+) Transcript_12502:1210-1980(+)